MADLTLDALCNISNICYCGIRCCALGSCIEGGNLFAKRGRVAWIVAPATSEVSRCWPLRAHAVTTAQAAFACGDWYIPSRSELTCGFDCKTYWNAAKQRHYWSDSEAGCTPPIDPRAWTIAFLYAVNPTNIIQGGFVCACSKPSVRCVRAIRKVFY